MRMKGKKTDVFDSPWNDSPARGSVHSCREHSPMAYGKELILDIHNCKTKFSRETITDFMRHLCYHIDMERHDLYFWDYEDDEEAKAAAPAHLAGTSAVQFITTSNITIHTLDRLEAVYLNIFTCSSLPRSETEKFCTDYWQGVIVNSVFMERK